MSFLSPPDTPLKEQTLQLAGDERVDALRVKKIVSGLKLGQNGFHTTSPGYHSAQIHFAQFTFASTPLLESVSWFVLAAALSRHVG